MQHGCYPSLFNAMRQIHEVFIREMLAPWQDCACGEILKGRENTGIGTYLSQEVKKPPITHRRLVSDYIRICSILAISSALN